MGAKEYGEERDDCSSDLEKDFKHSNDGESDYEPARDSLSSQGETATNTDNKVKRASRVPKKLSKREPSENGTRTSRGSANRQQHGRLLFKASSTSQKKCQKPVRASDSTKTPSNKRKESASDPSIVSSEETEDKTIEDVKEIHVMDEAPVWNQRNGTDNETVATEENVINDDKACVSQKIEELEFRIEKLEEELREVAALEISLYSVVPEHGSSAHKVHTPARRLSRLYIHACKYWTQDKKATIAKNTVSGLLLIAKSSGSDVSRLAFWLSNTVVLREIISQTFGNLSNFNATMKMVASNAGARKTDEQHTTLKWKINSGNKNGKNLGLLSVIYDWQDTSTFTQALEKIESWIFSRIVESVWWQTLAPHMQTPMEDLYTPRISEKLLEPSLGDQPQGSFSINLWKSAFHNAFSRICPVRAGGHECGCLPVLARKVMEQCVSRLDVAMFNAILRESAYEIPTNPISDPIIDPKVLPIPAGNLSFGSGAQLKNSIGNWSRWFTDVVGMDDDDSQKEDGDSDENGNGKEGTKSKSFRLLNELSDLLMLPKDMLLEKAVRKEVCPSIGLPLITRVLCNFSPDEFCPDPVPGVVLEELNTEDHPGGTFYQTFPCSKASYNIRLRNQMQSILERRLSEKELIRGFPCAAAPVVYLPPSADDVAEKVGDVGGRAELDRRASMVQRKGYTSDEDLDELDNPLAGITDKTTPISPSPAASDGDKKENSQANSIRHKLLREVWCV